MDSTSKSFSARGGVFWAPPTSMLGFWLAWSCADLVLIVKTVVRSRCDSLVMLDDHCFLVLPFNLWLLQPFRPIFCDDLGDLILCVYDTVVPFGAERSTLTYFLHFEIYKDEEEHSKPSVYKAKFDQNTAFFSYNMLPMVSFILQ